MNKKERQGKNPSLLYYNGHRIDFVEQFIAAKAVMEPQESKPQNFAESGKRWIVSLPLPDLFCWPIPLCP